MSKYNASVKVYRNGVYSSVYTAQVNEQGKMLRGNWVQFTKYDGTEIYHQYMELRHEAAGETFEVIVDDCKAYKDKIASLCLPSSYR